MARWLGWLVFLIVLALMLTFFTSARAHDPETGDPNWIEQNRYVGTDNVGCCGVRDCERVPANEIQARRDGFFLTRYNETVPYSEATPSEDKSSWRCHKPGTDERRCFFFRYGAS